MADTYTNKTLREIIRVVAGRFVGIAVIILMVVSAVALATYYAPRTYRSQIRLLAKPSRMTSPLESDVSSLREQVSLFVATQREIILSDYVLASALMALEGEKLPTPAELDNARVEEWDRKVQTYISGDPGKGIPGHGEYLRRVAKRVEMVTPGGPDSTFSQTLMIRVDWSEEQTESARAAMGALGLTSRQVAAMRAHDMARYIMEAHLARYARLETDRSKAAAAFLTKQALEAARKGMDDAGRDLDEFVGKVKGDLLAVINLTRYSAGMETGVASLTTRFQGEMDKIDERLAEVRALLKAVDAELAKNDPSRIVVPDAITAQNPSVTTLQAKIINLKLQINQLQARYTEVYRELADSRTELAAAERELWGEMAKQRDRLNQELSVLAAQRESLARTVAQHRARADELASKTATYDRLREAMASAQAIYDNEKKRVVSAATAEKLAANPVLVTVLDDASFPDPKDPRKPVLWINMLVAIVAGSVLALAYAVLADHFDHSLKGIDSAERYLGSPVLASVPKLGRRIITVQ